MSSSSTRRPASQGALACVAGAIPAEQRSEHFALIDRLFAKGARERREISGGYAFRFDSDAFGDVARFVENERRCCPFLAFSLDLSAESGPLWLHLSGPGDTRAFLDAELLKSRGPQT